MRLIKLLPCCVNTTALALFRYKCRRTKQVTIERSIAAGKKVKGKRICLEAFKFNLLNLNKKMPIFPIIPAPASPWQ